MVVAMVTAWLDLPGCFSLKDKRAVVKALTARLRRDLNVSVAEVGDQEAWQRCELGIAIAAGSETGARRVAQQVGGIIDREHRAELVVLDVEITAPEPA